MDLELKQSDISVLEAAKKSNGGGIRLYPANKAVIDRLVKAGLLTPKKGNVTSVELYVITIAGRQALTSRDEAAQYAKEKMAMVLPQPDPVTTLLLTERALKFSTPRTLLISNPGTPSARDQWVARTAMTTPMSREEAKAFWDGVETGLKVHLQQPLSEEELQRLIEQNSKPLRTPPWSTE